MYFEKYLLSFASPWFSLSPFGRVQLSLGLVESVFKRRWSLLVVRHLFGFKHYTRIQAQHMLGLVGQVGWSILHPGDLGFWVGGNLPICVGYSLFLALLLEAPQLFVSRFFPSGRRPSDRIRLIT